MTAFLLTALLWHASPQAGTPQAQAMTPQFQPEVSDPMLAPVPPAPIQVGSWDEALALLRQRSTDLRAALAQVEVAAGQRRAALAGLLPSLQGTLSVQSNVLDPSATPVLGGGAGGGIGGGAGGGTGTGGDTRPTSPLGTGVLTASVPLFNWSSIQSLRSASASRRAAELSLDETRRQLTGGLARALARVASSERLAEVNRVNLRSALERLALAQRRLELGAGTQLDVIRLRQDAESARSSVVSGDETLRQARDTLGLVLGADQPVGLDRGVSLEDLLNRGQRECRRLETVEQRPDLEAARAQLEAAEHSVSAARAQYLPTLAAQSTAVGLTVDPGFARVPVWNIGAVLTFPFYEGGAREGLVQQARAREETVRQQVVARQRAVSVEVSQTRREVDVAQAEQQIATRTRELAAENDRLTRRAFEVGAGTSQDLVVSAAALRQAELNLVVSEFQLFQARIEAFLAEAACDW
ncbi:TolC family protein [Archangium violaceum]|uniref:TolC family protein n=1 Tax=Archangium violaceum TaxID=83451 RepID=UPI00195046C9|nr:TolC family protein [Archangium violaceum]QRN96160.1 TolC family protein [Archangium violaceum]